MSISGGVDSAFDRGEEVGCDAMQIFTKNNNRWNAPPLEKKTVDRYHLRQEETGIAPVVAHTAYLLNLASPKDDLWERSLEALVDEMERCELLAIPNLVLHPGSHTGSGEDAGIARVSEALNRAHERMPDADVKVTLEVTAGQGSNLGYRFEHLARIIDGVDAAERLAVCFDTCHALTAGYDFRTPEGYEGVFAEFDSLIGLGRLEVFHLNDSLKDAGSKVDRHAHIGEGFVGLDAFRMILNDPRFDDLPMLLETPKGPDMKEDVENLRILRGLIG